MSCITVIGRRRYYEEGCDDTLPRSMPEWTASKDGRLYRMAESKNPKMRAVAAGHPRLPQGWMFQMLRDPDVAGRRAAVKNPALPDALMKYARGDKDPGIAAYANLMLEDNE